MQLFSLKLEAAQTVKILMNFFGCKGINNTYLLIYKCNRLSQRGGGGGGRGVSKKVQKLNKYFFNGP